MKLISMVDYVLGQKAPHKLDKIELFDKQFSYAKFLSMPLTLGMFVPCDENGNVLEKPKFWKQFDKEESHFIDRSCLQYKKALDNVIFEGFEYSKRGFVYKDFDQIDEEYCQGKTIEYLINNCDEIILTQSAITKYQI